jgi:hypothetical protein
MATLVFQDPDGNPLGTKHNVDPPTRYFVAEDTAKRYAYIGRDDQGQLIYREQAPPPATNPSLHDT